MLRHIFASLAAVSVAATALSLAPGSASAYEYLTNGGFETGAADWAASGGVIDPVEDATAIDGSYIGRLTIATQATYAIAQPIITDPAPAGTYTLSLSLREAPAGNAVSVDVSLRAGSYQRLTTVAVKSREWQRPQITVSSPASADLLVIITLHGSAGDSVDIDAVSVNGIDPHAVTPSPTTAPASPTEATRTPTSTPTRTATPTKTATATPDTYVGQLRNGGFESLLTDGGLGAWDHYGGSLSVATQPVHGGAQSARLESSTDSTKWLYQSVAVDAGSTYAFSAWVYDDDPGVASAFLRISWYASSDASGSAVGSVDSTTRLDTPEAQFRSLTTGSVTAPPDAHSARLRVMLAPISSVRAAIYIDDASFGPASPATATPAAEPSKTGVSQHSRAVSNVLGASKSPTGSSSGAVGAAPLAARSRVVINEVFYDSAAAGADADNEWVELYNAGDTDQDVAGWSLEDNASSDALPSLVVPARGYAIVAASDSFSAAYPAYSGPLAVLDSRIGNSLGNDGDRLTLKDGAGSAIDALSWGKDRSVLNPSVPDAPAGHSIERRSPGVDTDTAADFVDNLNPSPGMPFVPASAGDPKSQRQAQSASTVPIVIGHDNSFRTMFLWLALGSASTLVAGVAAWRFTPVVRRRLVR